MKVKCLMWIFFISMVFAVSIKAAVITNTNNSGAGSLRQTIVDATAGDTITFNIPTTDPNCSAGICTINLLNSLNIDKDLTITGTGATSLVIRRNPTAFNNFSIFVVDTSNDDVSFTVSDLTISNGNGDFGGGILNQGGTIFVSNVIFRDNAVSLAGGAILNDANANAAISNSTFINNSVFAAGGSNGGAITNDNDSVLTVTNSTFTGNSCGGSGGCSGGAISSSNGSTTNISDSVFNTNIANSSGGSNGGAISSIDSILVLTDSNLSNNTAVLGLGGGLSSEGATALTTVTRTTFSGNEANGGGLGGGFYNATGATAFVSNSTFSGNVASGSGAAGGGILNAYEKAVLNLTNVTVAYNSVEGNQFGSLSGGGGVNNSETGVVNTKNSIFTDNSASDGPDALGVINSLGFNLIGNTDGSSGWNKDDLEDNSNALLAPLGNNGGKTMTHSLTTGSEAINAGDAVDAPTSDQRGATRVGQVDIGAFEVNGGFLSVLTSGNIGTSYNQTLFPSSGNFNYTVTGGALPPGINLTAILSPNAVVSLSGTPTQTGQFNFQITGTDGISSHTNSYFLEVFAPNSALVSVGGRIFDSSGQAVYRALVIITDTNGNSRTLLTNNFGFYKFEDVEVGATYTFTVKSKKYTFAPQVVTVTEQLDELNFTALP